MSAWNVFGHQVPLIGLRREALRAGAAPTPLTAGADAHLDDEALARLQRVATSGMSWFPAVRDADAVEVAFRLLQDLESTAIRLGGSAGSAGSS